MSWSFESVDFLPLFKMRNLALREISPTTVTILAIDMEYLLQSLEMFKIYPGKRHLKKNSNNNNRSSDQDRNFENSPLKKKDTLLFLSGGTTHHV